MSFELGYKTTPVAATQCSQWFFFAWNLLFFLYNSFVIYSIFPNANANFFVAFEQIFRKKSKTIYKTQCNKNKFPVGRTNMFVWFVLFLFSFLLNIALHVCTESTTTIHGLQFKHTATIFIIVLNFKGFFVCLYFY